MIKPQPDQAVGCDRVGGRHRLKPGGRRVMMGSMEIAGASVSRAASGLLERASELSRLHQCASDTAETRSGRVLFVYGEAGIGKTALLRQFRSALPRRFSVLWGACDPLFTPRPLGPLLELPRSWAANWRRSWRGRSVRTR
jgi:AAA ATPase domain